jgi:hypothetical protein
MKKLIIILLYLSVIFAANSTEKQNDNKFKSYEKSLSSLESSFDKMDSQSIIILISRAYVFGQGNDRFCSPEISVTNLGNVGVRIIAVAIYFRKNNKNIGSSITRMSIDPRDTTTRGYYQLNTINCDDIIGVGRVDVCILRNGKDCEQNAIFADTGKIPLHKFEKN